MFEHMPVRVEVWPVAADRAGIWLLSGVGPWVSGNVPADGEPHAEVELVLSAHCVDLARCVFVHSTSWRVDGSAVVLTYVVVVDSTDYAPLLWPLSMPVTPELAEAVGPAEAGPTVAPPVPRYVDVLLHALRHVRFLLDTDAGARSVLSDAWVAHLEGFAPALSGMYQRVAGPVAWR